MPTSHRTVGIEIEFNGSKQAVFDELRNRGIRVVDRFNSHTGSSNRSWMVKRDGSVPRGGELVSPILNFDRPQWREDLKLVCEALQAAGATTAQECGIHIHIGAKQADGEVMTARQIASVVRFTYKFEDAIYRIASSGHATIRPGVRTYARPIPEETAQILMKVKTREELDAIWAQGNYARLSNRRLTNHRSFRNLVSQERYCGTNLHALAQHGTIEFRYFNSSLNHKRIEAYAAFCMAIMDDARNGFSRSTKVHYPIGSMARGEITQEKLFLRLQQIFRTNGRDTLICMSEDDWKNLRAMCWNKSVAQNPTFWNRTSTRLLERQAEARRRPTVRTPDLDLEAILAEEEATQAAWASLAESPAERAMTIQQNTSANANAAFTVVGEFFEWNDETDEHDLPVRRASTQ